MGDVITRFKLETSSFDSKLRDTAKALQGIAHQAQFAGKDFNGFSQKSIEAARALGTVASGATNTKDKLKDLVGSYNDAAKAYNSLSDAAKNGEFGQALSSSLQKLQIDIKQTKEELYGLGDAVSGKGGGLFGENGLTGMMQVFGGNLLTKGVTMLTSELTGAIEESINLAKQGEGIRMAFDRLNQPGLLDKLKDATHGTVSEIELMQQAIKFDNFKLPLEDLANYLAFAQQKAKDTGESIDYLVNSITTGLGRQSKQILDNLGISAAELTKRMNEGADMTKAVADIIREEMEKAGDYVETAADRAAKAAADAANEMEAFGRQAAPIAEQWVQTWNALSIGAMDFASTLLGPLAESIRSLQNLWNNGWEDNIINSPYNLENNPVKWPKKVGTDHTVHAPGGYVEVTDKNTGAVIGGQHFDNLNDTNAIKAWQKTLIKTPKTSKTTKAEKDDFEEIIGLIPNAEEAVKSLQQQISQSWDEGEIERLTKELESAEKELQRLKNIGKPQELVKGLSGFNAQTMSAWMSGRQSDLKKAEYGTKEYQDITANIADMQTIKTIIEQRLKAGLDAADADGIMESLWERVFDGQNIPDDVWAGLTETINEKLKELGIDPIKINFDTGNIEKEGKKTEKSWQAAAQAVESVGGAMQSIEDPAAKVAGTVMQAIASVALGYAQATTQAATLGPWAWVAFAATGMAQMISMIQSIHSATGYAEGGIIKGNSYSGDNIPIMANAGEVVLTKAMTNNLAAGIQSQGMGGWQLKTRLAGTDLLLSVERTLQKQGYGKIATWG